MQNELTRSSRGVRTVWVLALLSLALTLVGIFYLRLWLAGWIIGVVALVMSIVWAVRSPARGKFPRSAVYLSIAATVLPLGIAVITLVGSLDNSSERPERIQQEVEFLVEAEGEFNVGHTVPAEPGSDVAGVLITEGSDSYSFSFNSDMGPMDFSAYILQSNLGVQEITCSIKINGEVVLTRTGDSRFVDCSSNLQELTPRSAS